MGRPFAWGGLVQVARAVGQQRGYLGAQYQRGMVGQRAYSGAGAGHARGVHGVA